MIDLALFVFIMGMLALGVRRPYLWVLTYIYIDILTPQRIGWSITPALPLSLIAFCAAFAGWLAVDSKRGTRFTGRQGLMLALLLYCWVTTNNADFPVEAALKWDWVWKALVFAIFLPLTLRTRLRIEAAALVIVLTAGAIVINGGMKTALGGGGYESLYLFVNDNSGIYESSTLSTASIALIPLIVWFTRHGTIFPPDWRVKTFGYALIFACLLIPIGTEARTGLLCIAVLAVLMLRDVKRRMLFMIGGGLLAVAALPFLPQSYYERMGLIAGHEQDASASTRVAVWSWTIDYAADNPWGGGFDAYLGNKFTYDMPVETNSGTSTTVVTTEKRVDEGRAYHSAVFEMLGEQGWPGLILWLLIQLTGLYQMEKIRRNWRSRDGPGEAWLGPMASALQAAQIVCLVGAMFQGIAYQPFVLMILALQIGLHTYARELGNARYGKRRTHKAGRRTVSEPVPEPKPEPTGAL